MKVMIIAGETVGLPKRIIDDTSCIVWHANNCIHVPSIAWKFYNFFTNQNR